MTPEQRDLLLQARESLNAARLLHGQGYHGFAASRAYYTMFYVAEAILLTRELAYSKHGGVHSGFGEHFVKTGLIPPEYHRYLIRGMEVRHSGDYGDAKSVTPEETAEQIARADQFFRLGESFIGTLPPDTE